MCQRYYVRYLRSYSIHFLRIYVTEYIKRETEYGRAGTVVRHCTVTDVVRFMARNSALMRHWVLESWRNHRSLRNNAAVSGFRFQPDTQNSCLVYISFFTVFDWRAGKGSKLNVSRNSLNQLWSFCLREWSCSDTRVVYVILFITCDRRTKWFNTSYNQQLVISSKSVGGLINMGL